MAKPRLITEGAAYIISRRTGNRQFRLRPSSRTCQIMMYCLAYAAMKAGVALHGYIVMDNHHHIVVTDPLGRLPEFLHLLHMLTAKAMNALQGRWENFWAPQQTSVQRLLDVNDVLEQIGYVAANPVKAGLVRRPEDWPGVVLWRPGTQVQVKRPEVYFGRRFPEELTLRIEQPPNVADEAEHWRERVEEAVKAGVQKARARVEASGVPFLGREGVLKGSIEQRAKSRERRRGVSPTFSGKVAGARLAFIRVQQRFRSAYRVALEAWRGGDREVEFPLGTWWMRVHHGAAVAATPA